MQSAVGSGSYEQYKKYSHGIHNLPPINIRDLLEFDKSRSPIDVKEVEPLENILKRFGSGSMSHGALSAEARDFSNWNEQIKEPLVAVKAVKMLRDLKFFQMVIVQIRE